MSRHDIIVIGASAGGVEALMALMKGLPADLPAAIFIVLHVSSDETSALPQILERVGTLPVKHAMDGEAIQPGQVYIAPPNHHLLVRRGLVRVTDGAMENGHRPAVDPLFRSAARAYDSRVIGVVLSGMLDDGTAGLQVVKVQHGIAVVQDPDDALFEGMPRSAVEHVDVDFIVPLKDVAALLIRLVHEPAPDHQPEPVDFETEMAEFDMDAISAENRPGNPSEFACPTCGGVLWEIDDGKLMRYRCRVGHAFSPESLLAEQSEALEVALWAGLRALEERASLLRRMAKMSQKRPASHLAARFTRQAEDAENNAVLIRDSLLKNNSVVNNDPPANVDEQAKPGR